MTMLRSKSDKVVQFGGRSGVCGVKHEAERACAQEHGPAGPPIDPSVGSYLHAPGFFSPGDSPGAYCLALRRDVGMGLRLGAEMWLVVACRPAVGGTRWVERVALRRRRFLTPEIELNVGPNRSTLLPISLAGDP